MIDVEGVVYSISCVECSATYVGETGRTLRVHVAEHRRAVKNKDPNNGIAMHTGKAPKLFLFRSLKSFVGRHRIV